jgi:hypothetical protein
MKKYLIIFLVLLVKNTLAQQTHLQWTTIENTSSSIINQTYAQVVDKLSNIYSLQYLQRTGSGQEMYNLFCYDSLGNKKWEYLNDSCTGCSMLYNKLCVVENDVILAGKLNAGTGNNVQIKRIDNAGNEVWKNTINLDAELIKVLPDNNNDILLLLKNDTTGLGIDNYTIARCSKQDGSLLHLSIMPDTLFRAQQYTDAVVNDSNTILVLGKSLNIAAQTYSIDLFELDSVLQPTHHTIVSTDVFDLFGNITPSISKGLNHNYYIAHNQISKIDVFTYNDTLHSIIHADTIDKDSSVLKLVDATTINGNLFICYNSAKIIPDNSTLGYYLDNENTNIIKLDTALNTVWQKEYLPNFDNTAPKINFGGALQLAAHNNQLSYVSLDLKDTSKPYFIIGRVDTAGTLLWYDSVKIFTYNKALISAYNNNTFLHYTDIGNGFKGTAKLMKYTDYLNFYQNIKSVNNTINQVLYGNNFIKIISNKIINNCTVYTLDGKLLTTYFNTSNEVQIPTDAFAPGIYLASINNNSVIKFVKK